MMNRKLTITIIIIIVLAAAAFAGLLYAKNAENKAAEKAAQQAQAAEQKAQAEKEKALEEQKLAEEKREYEIADHVYSHRGASGDEIEHTLAAYDKAIEDGSHNIEQDLVISADGTLYVSHDLTSNRITGSGGYYSEMTDSQIDALRTSDGQKILKLSEVFEKYDKSVTYIIELKSTDSRTMEAFEDIVDKYDMADNVVVQCCYLEVLKQLEEDYPDMPKLHWSRDQWSFENALTKDYVDIASVESSLMTSANCDAAHESGKDFNAWPLNSESAIKAAIEMGADSYFTDYTDLGIACEKKYRDEDAYQKSRAERKK